MTRAEQMQRESNLIHKVKEQFPGLVEACASDVDVVVLHQDAFAADYQEDEFVALGMAVKYAGLCGKEVRVVGKNRQTVDENNLVH